MPVLSSHQSRVLVWPAGDLSTRIDSYDDEAVHGSPGEEHRYTLELKTLADVGLVGLPNAGKSTFLQAVSRAHPQVGAYPFTTLNPHLGVVEFADTWRMTIADIPGIIAGAHEDRGLGHRFLRHIERTMVHLFIVDASGQEGHPCEALDTLVGELEHYHPGITTKPAVVAANKMDVPGADDNLRELERHTDWPIIPVAAQQGHGIPTLTATLRSVVQPMKDDGKKANDRGRFFRNLQQFRPGQ